MRRSIPKITIGLALVLLLAPQTSFAQGTPPAKGNSHASIWDKDEAIVPLEDQVAIRHRYELRKGRFEVGPAIAFTLNRAFMNAVLFGLRAQYHINDYLSLGTEWTFGVNYQSPLTGELDDTYNNDPNNKQTPEPQAVFNDKVQRLSRIDLLGDVRINFTPLSGKMGIFSALFIGYDFYAFAGVAFGKTSNDIDDASGADLTNEAFNVGFAWGLGMHVFVNNWISVGLELKDLMFNDNETGQDITRGREDDEQTSCKADPTKCRLVNGDDRRFLNHYLLGINVTFFFPLKPDIAF